MFDDLTWQVEWDKRAHTSHIYDIDCLVAWRRPHSLHSRALARDWSQTKNERTILKHGDDDQSRTKRERKKAPRERWFAFGKTTKVCQTKRSLSASMSSVCKRFAVNHSTQFSIRSSTSRVHWRQREKKKRRKRTNEAIRLTGLDRTATTCHIRPILSICLGHIVEMFDIVHFWEAATSRTI